MKKGQGPLDFIIIIVVISIIGILAFVLSDGAQRNNTAVQASGADPITKSFTNTTTNQYVSSFNFAILLMIGIVMAGGIIWASTIQTSPIVMFIVCGLVLVVAWVVAPPLDGLFTSQTSSLTGVRAAIPEAAGVLDHIFYIMLGLEIIMMIVFFARNRQTEQPI